MFFFYRSNSVLIPLYTPVMLGGTCTMEEITKLFYAHWLPLRVKCGLYL